MSAIVIHGHVSHVISSLGLQVLSGWQWNVLRQFQREHRMKYANDLKTVTVVWWRFFWRYAVIFITINILIGIAINFGGRYLPRGLYMITIFSGISANILATMISMYYCLNRKFKKSPLVLQGKSEKMGPGRKFWTWFLYFWRFAIIAFLIAFALGALLPICFRYWGLEPIKALKYSKYLGNIAVLPASYLAFISLVCRREKRQTLRIAVSE